MEQTPKLPCALTNIPCTFTKPSPNLPFIFEPTHKFSNIPQLSPCTRGFLKTFLNHCPCLPKPHNASEAPQRERMHVCVYVCTYVCMYDVCMYGPGGLCMNMGSRKLMYIYVWVHSWGPEGLIWAPEDLCICVGHTWAQNACM